MGARKRMLAAAGRLHDWLVNVTLRTRTWQLELEALVRIMRQLDEHAAAYAEEEAS